MALHSFCGILTLQVGVAMLAIIYWLISALTFVVNSFEFFKGDTWAVALTISSFVILLAMAGTIAFFSAYNENSSLCMAGVALTCLITVVWVIASSLSFYNDQTVLKFVCLRDRCPESFWLAPLMYRLQSQSEQAIADQPDYGYTTDESNTNTTMTGEHSTTAEAEKENEEGEEQGRKKRSVNTNSSPVDLTEYQGNKIIRGKNYQDLEMSYFELNDIAYYFVGSDPEDKVVSPQISAGSGYIFGLPLVGAVILFICNFFLFLFSILVLWSYGQELDWTNSYLSDIGDN